MTSIATKLAWAADCGDIRYRPAEDVEAKPSRDVVPADIDSPLQFDASQLAVPLVIDVLSDRRREARRRLGETPIGTVRFTKDGRATIEGPAFGDQPQPLDHCPPAPANAASTR